MLRLFLLSLSLLTLVSCGSTFNVYKENFKLLLDKPVLPAFDRDFVAARRADIIQVEINTNQAIMALAFSEHGEDKFISADNAFIILAKGRIVRTSGFDINLLHTANLPADPLNQPFINQHNVAWQTVVQTSSQPALKMTSDFTLLADTFPLDALGMTIPTRLVEETVKVDGKNAFKNLYWYDSVTGELVKTVQNNLNAESASTIVFLSRINRLLDSNSGAMK
jgi:uncharacterized protein YcfL